MRNGLAGFGAELKRRRVFRVAGAYAVVAFVIAQVADIAAPGLNLPEWSVSLVLLLLILGFPLAIALAWVFDVTPRGLERTGSPRRARQSRGPKGRSDQPSTTRRFDSIAVLPLVDLSPDRDQEYFSDGLTEELLNVLAKVHGLRVPARTSSFAFKGQNADIREIGDKLDVDTVLEGSVRKWENRVLITAQLIQVDDGYHLWSETYKRELKDIFEVQEEIARAIVGTLRGSHLAGGAAVEIASNPNETTDTEVYQLYLKGRYFWNQRTPEGLEKARGLFEEAVRRAPDYAPAHSGLADTYFILVHYGQISPGDAVPLARQAAERAVALDASLEEAHLSLGKAREMEWRWAEAERALRRGVELNPGSARAHHWYGIVLVFTGRLDEALAELRHAASLDPLSLPVSTGLAVGLTYSHRFDEAIRECERGLELAPGHAAVLGNLSQAYTFSGRHEEAIAAAERAMQRDPSPRADLASAYAYAGRREEAVRLLEEMEAQAKDRHVPLSELALGHLALGDTERALDLWERALEEERDPNVAQIASNPASDPVRDHPRFRALLARMNLEPAAYESTA